jgi:hypothetical protein
MFPTTNYQIKSKVGLDIFTKLYEKDPTALNYSPNSIGYIAGYSFSAFDQELTALYPDNGSKIEICKWKTTVAENGKIDLNFI